MSNQNQAKAEVVSERTIVDSVLSKINKFQEQKELVLPKDYCAENALKSAYLILTETYDNDKNLVLLSCSPASIANTLLEMVVKGLSPMKKQCYFIAYGGALSLSVSYQGNTAIAKRVGLKSIISNVIFNDDIFVYEINNDTGLIKILEHNQSIENIDIDKIKGAYAITTLEDGTRNTTIMTMAQIKKSWMQGYAKGVSGAHNNFTDEMCKKTVINRACKSIINSSTDIVLTTGESQSKENTVASSVPNIETKQANTKEIGIPETQPNLVPEQQAEPELKKEFKQESLKAAF